MNKFFLSILFSALSAHAGVWTRTDSHSIRFEGYITAGDSEALDIILRSNDKILFVNSKGGDAEVGLQLAIKLFPNKLTIIVDGNCASSCANYLFTAGAKKEIKKGWVGYHGNMTALLAMDWGKNAREMKVKNGLTDKQIESFHSHLLELAQLEKKYLATIGVNQSLFNRTQSEDKGMGDGKSYTFLCPKPETFELYGIKNVTGHQDIVYESLPGLNNILD